MTAAAQRHQMGPETTAAPTAGTVPVREVKARRIAFDYPETDLPRHFANDGDLLTSHMIAMLSAVFPEGEDFFVRSVRDCRDRVTDLELRKQVGGFIGQEAIHGREHRAFNERLQERGYPTRWVDRNTKWWFALYHRVMPVKRQVAVTAALEHYTATLAECILTDERARSMSGAPEVRSLFLWHALEESEHKAVAFDVYRHVFDDEGVRIRTMRLTTVMFVAIMVTNMAVSIAQDPAARDLPRLWRSLKEFRRNPFLSRQVRRRIGEYNRRGFHPDDHDNTALLERWREELFGERGELTEMLRRSAG